jgi:hypothetical protein
VWVCGDIEGYEYIIDVLEKAKSATRNTHVKIDLNSKSMIVVVLPAAKRMPRRARIRLIERCVCWKGRKKMELVIFGTKEGYTKLAGVFREQVKSGIDEPGSHTHVNDEDDSWVIKRSVSLNVRGPLRKWRSDSLDKYSSTFKKWHRCDLPEYYQTQEREPYLTISASNSFHLRRLK